MQYNNQQQPTIKMMQIIAASLVVGVVAFALIAVFVVGALDEPPESMLISAIAAGFAAVVFVLHLVIPPLVISQQARAARGEQLYGVYLTKMILGLALLEGAAFFNIVAALIEHNWWSLAIAGGLAFWMLALFPTRTRVDHWIETQQMLQQTGSN